MVHQIWEPCFAWVEVVPGGSEEEEAWARKRSLLPEGVETGLSAEVFCLLARGEHAVYTLAHGIVCEPRIRKCLTEFFDFWGESCDVSGCDLDGGAPVLNERHVKRVRGMRGGEIPLRDGTGGGPPRVEGGERRMRRDRRAGVDERWDLPECCIVRASF